MAGNADEDHRHGKEKQKDEDGRGGKQKDVASTSGGGKKKVMEMQFGRYKVGVEYDSSTDWKGKDPFDVTDMFKIIFPIKWSQVRHRILRMPENVAGDPSGSKDPCEYSTSGEAPPPSSSSDSDVDETKKVSEPNLRMPASSSENVAGDFSGSQAPCEYSTSGQAPPPYQ